jgi:hypothetical protein
MKSILCTSAIILTITGFANAASLVVPGSANIFGAGQASPPNTGVGGPGSLPPTFTFQPGPALSLTFSSVTGSVSTGGFTFGPDGEGSSLFPTDMNSFQSLSGIKASRAIFLVGVFLDDNAPSGTAPARLDFTAAGLTLNFLTLSPLLNQLFYVGDGTTGDGGSGISQAFNVPAGASRLFLGIVDGEFNGAISGTPGNYSDNSGSFTAEFAVVPEPSSVILLGTGILAFQISRRRVNRNA